MKQQTLVWSQATLRLNGVKWAENSSTEMSVLGLHRGVNQQSLTFLGVFSLNLVATGACLSLVKFRHC